MPKSPEGYKPSPEEIKKAENMMTPTEKAISETREESYYAGRADESAVREAYEDFQRKVKEIDQLRSEYKSLPDDVNKAYKKKLLKVIENKWLRLKEYHDLIKGKDGKVFVVANSDFTGIRGWLDEENRE